MIINHQLDDYLNSDQEQHKPSKPNRAEIAPPAEGSCFTNSTKGYPIAVKSNPTKTVENSAYS